MHKPPDVRIVADDLTGALDSAAAFASPGRPIGVWWAVRQPMGAAAVDVATREGPVAAAIDRHRVIAPWLFGGATAFKKIDSLLRGHWAAEVAVLASADERRRLVVAPAFPFQGRITRDGFQWRADDPDPIGPRIIDALGRAGVEKGRICVHDAGSDQDLDRIVAEEVHGPAPLLWVGTGGLAAALGRRLGSGGPSSGGPIEHPVLGLIGTHHAVSMGQIARASAAWPDCHIVLGEGGAGIAGVGARLAGGRSSLVTVAVTGDRVAAAETIAARFSALLGACGRPGSLFVAGGETLRGIVERLGAGHLAVEGAIEPGLPVSRLVGGPLDGILVISKSGAFGRPDLLCDLLRDPADMRGNGSPR